MNHKKKKKIGTFNSTGKKKKQNLKFGNLPFLETVLRKIFTSLREQNGNHHVLQGKKSSSSGGPFRIFSCRSTFLGSTISVASPNVKKYLSKTIFNQKQRKATKINK